MTPRRWIRTAVTVVACLTPSATHAQATAEPAPRQTRVLSLHTLPKDAAFIDTTERIYRSVLASALGDRLDYSSEQLADYHFPDPSGESEFEDYLVRKYRDRPIDLLLASGVTAAIFAGRLQARLPSHPPIVFSGLFTERPVPKSTGYAYQYAMKESLDLALRIHPDTREVFLVSGASPHDKWHEAEFRSQVPVPPPGVRFTSLQGLSVRDLSERLVALPQHSIIFLLALTSDENGRTFQSEGLVDRLAASSTAPIYTWNGNVSGPFGGRLLSTDLVASSTIDVALRVLRGEPAESIPLNSIDASVDALDWRQLHRWNVSAAGVPSGVLLRFREPGPFEEYRSYVLTAVGLLLVQSLLIAGLLYQRRARQRAESDSRRNLALAADASRRETMSALTSSIGHELGQPLCSIVSNANALQMMVTANRASSDTIREILTDIQTQGVQATQIIDRHRTMLRGHQLDKKSIDVNAVVEETLRLVEHTITMRQVEARIDLSGREGLIDGDPVLLQQVFVNLVVNAIDAMSEISPARRRVTISSQVRASDVDVTVRDSGPGVPAHMIATLFVPFATTKAHGVGIGLTIVKSIIDAHGGTIVARNHPEGGAAFTVTLRRTASAALGG
jgi:signal transduction histidine kinase